MNMRQKIEEYLESLAMHVRMYPDLFIDDLMKIIEANSAPVKDDPNDYR